MSAKPFVGGPLDRFYFWSRSYGSPRNVLIVVALYAVLFALAMLTVTFLRPAYVDGFIGPFVPPLEISPATAGTMAAAADDLGQSGRDLYVVALGAGLVRAALLAFAGSVILGYVLERRAKRRSHANRILLVPLVLAAVDIAENLALMAWLSGGAADTSLAWTATVLTGVKLAVGLGFVALAATGLVLAATAPREDAPAAA